MTFSYLDWIVVFLYVVVVGTAAFYLIKSSPKTSEGYFLAGRNVRWPFIGASILVSNISTEHFIGLAGLSFAFGWAVASWELIAIYCMVPLILLFLPLYLKTGVFTIPEFLERRFSPGSRLAYALYMIAWNVFTKISISLLAAGIAFENLMGWNRWAVILVVGLSVTLYTMKGGLSVVIYTDFIQTTVLLIAGLILAALGLQAVGGLEGLKEKLPTDRISLQWLAEGRYVTSRLHAGLPVDEESLAALKKTEKKELGTVEITDRSGASATIGLGSAATLTDVVQLLNAADVGVEAATNEAGNGILLQDVTSGEGNLVVANGDDTKTADLLGITSSDATSAIDGGPLATENMRTMFKRLDHPELPWLGVWLGVLLIGGINWSTDQVLVQRVLAAKDLNEGRLGVVFCQFLKLLTPLVLILPGLLAYALFRDQVEKPDEAFPVVLKNLMPHGLLGLAVAGMAAALMGHLSSTFHSNATMVSRDLYLKWRPNADQKSQIAVGRWAVLLSFLLGVAWVPVVEQFEYIWSYLVRIGAFLLMPYTAVFLFGILWKRTNTAGAWAAIIVGLTLAPILTIDSELHFLPILKDYAVLRPYLNASLVSLVACVIALVVTTLMTDPPPPEKLENTTFSLDQLRAAENGDTDRQHIPLYKDYRPWFVAALIIATTLIYITR